MSEVKLSLLQEKMNLYNMTPALDIENKIITVPDINRLGLPMAGYWGYFDPTRIQLIGRGEYEYLQTKTPEDQIDIFNKLFEYENIPCILFSRGQKPSTELVQMATKHNVPIFISERHTSTLTSEIIRWLHVQLAPTEAIHGVLVDVYGEGVLIIGESGIGKSEVALELMNRGHRLVSDDVVELRKVSDDTLVGSAPDLTRHFIELRGVGIINAKSLFGAEAVKTTQTINMVIDLEEWDKDKTYDRLGLGDQYVEYLGNKIICYHIPVRPGRNLAIIVEATAINHREKQMGYNAGRELQRRVENRLKGEEGDTNDLFF